MADAKAASSPSVSGDGGLAPAAPIDTIATVAAVASGGDASSEESEETSETRALAQGPCGSFASFFYYHLPAHHVDSRVLLCRYESSI
jgi:hypothetical protein